ncbi:hypothetical protein THIOKS12650021 [Thiocapsa sp. KS1]|nr:hypothetical protein THIOKS12650021 [Thiocapsa sp. KS1]
MKAIRADPTSGALTGNHRTSGRRFQRPETLLSFCAPESAKTACKDDANGTRSGGGGRIRTSEG